MLVEFSPHTSRHRQVVREHGKIWEVLQVTKDRMLIAPPHVEDQTDHWRWVNKKHLKIAEQNND